MNHANAISAGNPAAQPKPIPDAMGQLDTSIHEMGVLSDTLVNRLGSVMAPAGPSPVMGSAQATDSLVVSQQADEIHGYRRRVESISAQLQDVLKRLEV